MRIDDLHGRVTRFAAHPTLHTRIPGVRAEIASLETELVSARATARWAAELAASRT